MGLNLRTEGSLRRTASGGFNRTPNYPTVGVAYDGRKRKVERPPTEAASLIGRKLTTNDGVANRGDDRDLYPIRSGGRGRRDGPSRDRGRL